MAGNLAELSDVAVELGLDNSTAMSENQRARAVTLIARVSDLFSQEAQRDFVPGESTVRIRVQYRSRRNAFVRLSERPTEVSKVLSDDGRDITAYTIVGNEVRFTEFVDFQAFSGVTPTYSDFVTVTYTHSDAIPTGVVQAVAAIVARYIALVDSTGSTVQPSASSLQAGGGIVTYRAGFADWVTKSVQLTPEDKATARAYRYPGSLPIVVGV